jgi:rhamnose transport system substrate-binding protein
MKRLAKRSTRLAALMVSAALVLTACGGGDDEEQASGGGGGGGGGDELTVTFLPKNLGNPYFDTSDAGGKEAVEEFGGTFEEVGPQEASPDAQVQYINTAAQQGVSALVVSANDPKAICDAIAEAQDAGTKVVTFDSDTSPGCRDLYVNQASAEGIAKAQVDLDRRADRRRRQGRHPVRQRERHEPERLDRADGGGDRDNHPTSSWSTPSTATTTTRRRSTRRPRCCSPTPTSRASSRPTTVGIAAAARYLSDSDAKGKVALTGLGTPNQMREYVENGTVEAFALWNPGDLGYLAAYAAKALVDGDITGREGDTFEAGPPGRLHGRRGREVLLGDPFVFNARTSASSTSSRRWAGRRPESSPGHPSSHRSGDPRAPHLLPGCRSSRTGSRSTGRGTPPCGRDAGWRCGDRLHNYSLFLRPTAC